MIRARFILMAALACTAAAQTAAFDVASVRLSSQQWLQIAPQRSGGRISWTTDLTDFIAYAYDLPGWRISGAIPDGMQLYDVEATTSPDATTGQVRTMFQTLLAERFKFSSHKAVRDEEGFALTAPKGAAKLRQVTPATRRPTAKTASHRRRWFLRA